jgi:hypothetical protein
LGGTSGIMVPLSERRHRLYKEEIPEVVLGLRLRLEQLLEEKREIDRAEVAFRALCRLLEPGPGRPKYPRVEFTWTRLSYWLDEVIPHKLEKLGMVP